MDKLEAVVVSVGFGDYLAHTLPRLLPHCDEVAVYSSVGDDETLRVCARWQVRCVQSVVHCNAGSRVNKAAAQNHALQHLRRDGWLLCMDADIALPVDWRRRTRLEELGRQAIYGVDRVDCPNYATWAAMQAGANAALQGGALVVPPNGWPISPRVVHPDFGGWCPLGYFQLWHSSVRSDYCLSPGANCEHSDLLHASQWPGALRRLLPEWFAVHLLAGKREMGADWHGRVTERFGENPWLHVKAAVRSGKAPAVPLPQEGTKSMVSVNGAEQG